MEGNSQRPPRSPSSGLCTSSTLLDSARVTSSSFTAVELAPPAPLPRLLRTALSLPFEPLVSSTIQMYTSSSRRLFFSFLAGNDSTVTLLPTCEDMA
eukprot:scaffold2295_cov354-Prasinococcus_capsulatus_cf.AAC.6